MTDKEQVVYAFFDQLATGTSESEVLGEYPQLAPEDIRAAIVYGC